MLKRHVLASGGYFGTVPQLVSQQLLDERFASGAVAGYQYSAHVYAFASTATASPASSSLGRYGYYMLADGVIRYSTTFTLAPAGRAGGAVN